MLCVENSHTKKLYDFNCLQWFTLFSAVKLWLITKGTSINDVSSIFGFLDLPPSPCRLSFSPKNRLKMPFLTPPSLPLKEDVFYGWSLTYLNWFYVFIRLYNQFSSYLRPNDMEPILCSRWNVLVWQKNYMCSVRVCRMKSYCAQSVRVCQDWLLTITLNTVHFWTVDEK